VGGQGIIFDFDGTLADTLADLTDAVNIGLRTLGLAERSASEVRGWVGDGLPILCRRAVGRAADVSVEEMAAVITQYYHEHRLDKTTLSPGISDLLDALTERGMPLAILSNKPHEHTKPMADALLGRWPFVAVEGCCEGTPRKPDPRAALEIVARMRLEPARVLVVGDSATDVATALNGHLVPVGATWGYRSRQELIEAGAHHLIDRASDLLALV